MFLCGNGGSAGNAAHLANDFLYGISKTRGSGLRVTALTANPSVLTCLANDEGYEHIFAHQMRAFASQGDVLVAVSGSGNSPNIINAANLAKEVGMTVVGVTGFDGGKLRRMCDVQVHVPIDDMGMCEAIHGVLFHLAMARLREHVTKANAA